jgi:hypothetical protein
MPMPSPKLIGCFFVAVLLLTGCVALAYVVRRRRHQGKYPVQEKERLHGANGGSLYDEAQFGEYVRRLVIDDARYWVITQSGRLETVSDMDLSTWRLHVNWPPSACGSIIIESVNRLKRV